MRIGRSVFATIDGKTLVGTVTSIEGGENPSLIFTTPDGVEHFAAKGTAHKTNHVASLFEGDKPLFQKGNKAIFAGMLVSSEGTGEVLQVTNVDISGSFTLSDGTITSSLDSFTILGKEPYVSSAVEEPSEPYSDDESDDDDDSDDFEDDDDSEDEE